VRELTELSAYGARIKHERPIVLLCAKYLWRSGHDTIAEGGQHDLTVNGVTFEFKHHFDWDIPKALTEGTRRQRGTSETWRILPAIRRDITERRPDVFVWIISERALESVGREYCKGRVCFWRDQFRHEKRGWTSKVMLRKASEILDGIAAPRASRSYSVSVETRTRFVSKYHFLIRDFRHNAVSRAEQNDGV
jgi:hypothetical protein